MAPAVADTLNNVTKYVASTTLEEPLAWKNSILLKGEVTEAVDALRREPGKNIVVLGSGQLVRTLMQHDLIDEYELMIDPILLGGGKRLFEGGDRKIPLRLIDSRTTSTGAILATYRPEGR